MEQEQKQFDYDNIWNTVYGDMQRVGPVHRHMRRIIHSFLASVSFESVLDIGCGAGHNLDIMTNLTNSTRIAGLDISEVALNQARRHYPHVQFYQGDVQTMALDAQWDLVVCSLLLEHLPDDVAALHHMYAMTGKYLLVTTIAGNFQRYYSWEQQMGHVRNYAVGELESKMQQSGFHIERVVYWGFPFYTPLMRSLQNYMRSSSQFSPAMLIIALGLYYVYGLNLHTRGDLLIILARV